MYVGGIYALQCWGPRNGAAHSVWVKNYESKCFLAIGKVLIKKKWDLRPNFTVRIVFSPHILDTWLVPQF